MMKTKLFLDDLRDPPDDMWIVARTVKEGIEILLAGGITEVSLDHDMGGDAPTGYELLCWLEERIFIDGFPMPEITVHSANPSGRQKMELTIRRMKERLG